MYLYHGAANDIQYALAYPATSPTSAQTIRSHDFLYKSNWCDRQKRV
jgi:hypothetical protein